MTGLLLTALLTVVVHNTAEVPDADLTRAKAGVDRLLATAGVTIVWAESGDSAGFTIQVVIRRQPGGGPGAKSPSALGTTIGEDHSRGGVSFVFYGRVLTFAHAHKRPVGAVLGLAIAHELGHVLLPAPAHTPSGLMKAEWNDDDIRHLAAGAAAFTSVQATLMNTAIEGYRLNAAK
jgi:hypothetical protein